MIHQELSETIIGGAMKVLNALKPRLNEKAYENAMVIADPKVVEDFTATHLAQMMGYLTITNLRLALLLNFNMRTSAGNASSAKSSHPCKSVKSVVKNS